MSDYKYKLYGKIQFIYHELKGRNKKKTYEIISIYQREDIIHLDSDCILNGQPYDNGALFFKGDNVVEGYKSAGLLKDVPILKKEIKGTTYEELWLNCIKGAKVEEGWKNSGFYLTAYTKENKQWCLSNWIWTSAAIARILSKMGLVKEAQDVADTFIREQLPEGGWVVRYDFIDGHLNRLSAPNDSAYIARNALLNTYKDTGEERYLAAAKRCADWIIDTSTEDGLVLFGYNVDKQKWINDRNIVDIGFTADLFAELFNITKERKYRDFLERFSNAFIRAFYDYDANLFASHINSEKKQNGGYFSRGQAWAMEGLIAAYSVLKNDTLFDILEKLTMSIMANQLQDGGWYCNFQKARHLMGEDCKGVSAIARSLMDWAQYSNNKDSLIVSAQKALKWCKNHTDRKTGVILSFSCNGAIAHSLNTSTGILYANAYALELSMMLKK